LVWKSISKRAACKADIQIESNFESALMSILHGPSDLIVSLREGYFVLGGTQAGCEHSEVRIVGNEVDELAIPSGLELRLLHPEPGNDFKSNRRWETIAPFRCPHIYLS